MSATTDMLRGRQTATRALTNKSGSAVAAGDVVVIGDGANDNAFDTTTTAAFNARMVGVTMEAIANNATGLVAISGWVPKVNTTGTPAADDFLFTHTVAGEAAADPVRAGGAFGQVLEAGADPAAILFGMVDPTPGAATIPSLVGVKARASSGSFGSGSYTAVPFAGTDHWDTNAYHDPASNNTRITIPTGKDGYYLVEYTIENGSATGSSYIRKNGTTSVWNYGWPQGSGSNVIFRGLAILYLVATDYIEVMCSANSSTLTAASTFSATLIGV